MAVSQSVVLTSKNQDVTAAVTENSQINEAKAPKKFSTATTISNVGQFKEIAPDFHNQFMMGAATNIINESRRHSERLKKLIKESQHT